MAGFTGFGGSWSGGVHSGGDNSGSIGGGSGFRAPTAAEVAAQFNSYNGVQISAKDVSNIHADPSNPGRYSATLGGSATGFSGTVNNLRRADTGGFSGMPMNSNGGNPGVPGTAGVMLGNAPGQVAGINWLAAKNSTSAMQEIASYLGLNMHAANILAGLITAKNDTVRKAMLNIPGQDTITARNVFERLTSGEVKDAIKFTADFYKELTEKYSQNASILAQKIAEKSYGKTIRGVDQALVVFDKYKNVLNSKYSVADREAIASALMSVDRAQMALSLAKFSKAFNFVGLSIDVYDVVVELNNAIKTQNWRPLFVKLESLAVGRSASAITAFAFSLITGTAMGVFGFALIMALVGAFIDDSLIEEVNSLIGL